MNGMNGVNKNFTKNENKNCINEKWKYYKAINHHFAAFFEIKTIYIDNCNWVIKKPLVKAMKAK
jgi:hypothetical protein